jgi:hypothetical protein
VQKNLLRVGYRFVGLKHRTTSLSLPFFALLPPLDPSGWNAERGQWSQQDKQDIERVQSPIRKKLNFPAPGGALQATGRAYPAVEQAEN